MTNPISPIKHLLPSLFLIIALFLLMFAVYQQRNSVEYQRAMLLQNPQPAPFYFDSVYPKPGAIISYRDIVEPYPCFEIYTSDGLLGINLREIIDQNAPYEGKFEMLINGNPVYFHIGVLTLGYDETFSLCHQGSLNPGSYLTEIRVHGVIYKTYSWAFTITDN